MKAATWACVAGLALGSGLSAAEPGQLEKDEAAVVANVRLLAEPDPAVREKAAAELQKIVARYSSGTTNLREADGGETRWKETLSRLREGMTRDEALKILAPKAYLGEVGSGGGSTAIYALDDAWQAVVSFQSHSMREEPRPPPTFVKVQELRREGNPVYVQPPKDYAGVWTTWFANGQKATEAVVRNGRNAGKLTNYHDNGKVSWDQEIDGATFLSNGPGRGWYRDGSKMYEIQYRQDVHVGKWQHWYPNGQLHSETNYAEDGKQDGREMTWSKDGKPIFERNYKNGIRSGFERSWGPDGKLEYERLY